MEKEFLPEELALELRKIGFDGNCLARFDGGGFKMLPTYDPLRNSEIKEPWFCVTPLYQQAFRFFREKYRLDANIYECVKINDEDIYSFRLLGIKNYNFFYDIEESWHNYEEAELECIKKLIELCQTKK